MMLEVAEQGHFGERGGRNPRIGGKGKFCQFRYTISYFLFPVNMSLLRILKTLAIKMCRLAICPSQRCGS
jgi:hypothetical protein